MVTNSDRLEKAKQSASSMPHKINLGNMNFIKKKHFAVCLVIIMLLAHAPFSSAGIFTSIAPGGPLTTASTWDLNAVPTSSDTIIIQSGDTVTLTGPTTLVGIIINAGGVLDNKGNSVTLGDIFNSSWGTFSVNGEYTGSGTTMIDQYSYLNGVGIISTTGTWSTPNGQLNVLIGSNLTVRFCNFNVSSGNFSNAGTIVFDAGSFSIVNPSIISNSGVMTLTIGSITGTGGIWNYGNLTVGGNVLISGGTAGGRQMRNYPNSILTIKGYFSPSTTLFNYVESTVNYNGFSQTIKKSATITGAGGLLPANTYWHLQCSNNGTKTLPANTLVSGNLTIQDTAQLDITASTYSINIQGNWINTSVNADPFVERTGTVTFSGDSAQVIIADSIKKETFYNLVISDTGVVQNKLKVTMMDSVSVSNNISLVAGVLDLNQNVLELQNPNTTAIIGGSNNAYIKSEDITGNNKSRVQWNVKDSIGNYIIPFGLNKGGTDYYIPFSFNIATKGFETTTGTGNISISTYSTPTANTPYPQVPQLVTQVYNPANAVDRFWQVDVNNYTVTPTADLTFNYADPEKPLPLDTLVAQHWNTSTLLWDAPASAQTYTASTTYTTTGAVTISSVNTFSPWTLSKKTDYLKCPDIALTQNTAICYGIPQRLSTDTDPDDFYSSLMWNPTTDLNPITGDSVNATPGVGTVTYTVTGNDGAGCYNSNTVTIEVNPLPTLTGIQSINVCYGTDAVLAVSGGNSYNWIPAIYLSSATTGNVTLSQAPVGIQTYTVTGYDGSSLNCSNTHTLTVTVYALPSVNAGSDVPICIGDTVTLNAIGTGGDYTWSPGAYFVSNTGNAVSAVVPAVAGSYTCNVSLTDINNCSASDTVIVTVVTALIANAGLDVSMVCGTSTILTGSGGLTFAWSPATGLNPTNSSMPVFDPTAIGMLPGTYTYSLVVASGIGCVSAPDEVIITVDSISANAGADQSICSGSTANIEGTGGNAFAWFPATGLSDTTTGNTTFSLSEPGAYSYYLSVSNGVGCTSQPDAITITVIAIPTVSAGADITIRPDQSDTLHAAGNAQNYSWTPDVCSNCLNPVVFPSATTQYILTASNAFCTASDTVTAHYVPYPCNIYIPNAFSPNNDGYNDSIKVNSYCILPEGFAFRIFDRWGTLVFESFKQNESWDGKYDHQNLTSGNVFVYTVNGTTIYGDEITKKGNISLLR